MNILVIKLGALGDFILALPAFAAVRLHHPEARITLLTTGPFVALARASPYFDEILVDEKPSWRQLGNVLALRRVLRGGRFDRVYDLQTSGRTSLYFRLFRPGRKPEWSGIAQGASHPDPTPDRAAVHSFQLRINQLNAAGITNIPEPDLGWMKGDGARFALPARTALLVPGSAPHRPEKRWPAESFAALALRLVKEGYTPVVIGSANEGNLARSIRTASPRIVDLTGQTTLFDIADLARGASIAVGNDTGPMHLIAAAGCSSMVLFSASSRPAHSRPLGRSVAILQRNPLANLEVDEVEAALAELVSTHN